MGEKKDLLKAKRIVMLVLAVAAILVVMMIIYSKSDMLVTDNSFPSGNLSEQKTETLYSVDEKKYPQTYLFKDIPYSVAVPSKGIAKVEGGYAYKAAPYGLVVAEVASARSLQAYSSDVYASLYATTNQAMIRELFKEEGYINGFRALYAIYSVKLDEMSKTLYQVAYFLELDEHENIVLLATMDSRDLLTGARDMLREMISSVYFTDSVAEVPTSVDEDKNNSVETDSDGIVTREAYITAEYDYEIMLLTFSYMDIKSKPQMCKVFDINGIEYLPVDEKPGSISFKIPNVSKGDDIKLIVTSGDLKGASVEQIEYSEYQHIQDERSEGTLHVEEEFVEE